jgi:hypothetical protein
MGNGIYFKIAGYVDLDVVIILPNLVITRVSSFKIVFGDAVHQPTWPLLLKIEHMVKLQVLGNKVLKFYKFYEKRAITPRWVFRFTSKLQGR